MKVIYVDDEELARLNFRIVAEPLGEVDELHLFDDAQSTLEWVRSNDVNVAFLDLELDDDMGGMELARRLQQLRPSIVVVFVTAYSQHALEAFGVGAIGYVLKPYTCEDIRRALARAECSLMFFQSGQSLYRPHQFQRSLGILLSGSVRVTRDTLVINTLRPGDLFGAAALFNDVSAILKLSQLINCSHDLTSVFIICVKQSLSHI